jgi:hypothetical protein
MWRFWRFFKRGNEPSPPEAHSVQLRFYEVALVFPKINAVESDLISLGEALRAWMQRHPSITSIEGMEELLKGTYPPMEVYMGCINNLTLARPRWETCPAILQSPDVKIGSKRIREQLCEELPPDLYSYIRGPSYD